MDSPRFHAHEMEIDHHSAAALDPERAWQLVRLLAERARGADPLHGPAGFALHGDRWRPSAAPDALVRVDPKTGSVVVEGAALADARAMLELFMPLVVGRRASSMVVGHLGQSLDGRVATPTGASQFITGREDVVHTHRLRALFDAVVVGVRTVQKDDPQLTTRYVPGLHPTRVILDPRGKLTTGYKVLEDGAARTVVYTSQDHIRTAPRGNGTVDWVALPCPHGQFDVDQLLQALRSRGLRRIFIEGGGITISRFLSARALDRLHVGIAPMILGSGAPAFALPPIDRLDEALNFRCRHFSLGGDLLFDCELLQDGP